MRQDFAAILTDKYGKAVSVFDPFSFGYDATLTRHAQVGNYVVRAVLKRLSETPMRVAWVGDSSDSLLAQCEDMGGGFITDKNCFLRYVCTSPYVPIVSDIPMTLESSRACLGKEASKRCYIANITKGEYLDMAEYVRETTPVFSAGVLTEDDYIILDPLPLLTAVGNVTDPILAHEGDYFSGTDMNLVGSWAFDELFVTMDNPTNTLLCRNFTKVSPRFQYDIAFEEEVP